MKTVKVLILFFLFIGRLFSQTWSKIAPPSEAATNTFNKVQFINSTVGFIAGSSGILLKTNDMGNTWIKISSPTTSSIKALTYFNNTLHLAASSKYFKSNDDGNSWSTSQNILSGSTIYNINCQGNNLYSVGGSGNFYYSDNNGDNWNKVLQNTNVTLPNSTKTLMDVYAITNTKWRIAASGGYIYQTDDAGQNWSSSLINGNYSASGSTTTNSLYFTDDNIGYAVGSFLPSSGSGAYSVAFKTSNGGKDWNIISELIGTAGSDFKKISFINASNGVIVGSNGLVFITRDGGVTWNNNSIQEASSTILWDVALLDANTCIAVGGNGQIFKTSNAALPVELSSFSGKLQNGAVNLKWRTATEINNNKFEIERSSVGSNGCLSQWNKIGEVSGNGNINSVKNYSFTDNSISRLGSITSGKYIYRLKQIDNDGTFKYSSEVSVELGMPATFTMNQNYPNPFNPSTVISYQLSAVNNVELKIYDILGKEVATLVNEKQNVGVYNITFNTQDLQLASGLYIAKLNAGSFSKSIKMNLIK